MKVKEVFARIDQLVGQEVTVEGLYMTKVHKETNLAEGNFVIDPNDLPEINPQQALRLVGTVPHQPGCSQYLDGDHHAMIEYQAPGRRQLMGALRVTIVGQIQKLDQNVILTELKFVAVHSSISIRYFINTPVDLNRFRLRINEITQMDDILASPQEFMGKRVRVSGYWIETSIGSYLCGNEMQWHIEDSRKRALLLLSPLFEKAIANGLLMNIPGAEIFSDETQTDSGIAPSPKYAYTVFRVDEMQAIGEIIESTKAPFPLAITNIDEAIHNTHIGLYHWHLPVP